MPKKRTDEEKVKPHNQTEGMAKANMVAYSMFVQDNFDAIVDHASRSWQQSGRWRRGGV
jgi:hypothetical protein